MSKRQLKNGYFVLEGLNSFATTYYLYYLYFFMQTAFGFGNQANLALAAFNGLIYMVGSFFAGRFAQKYGYFTALKLGFAISITALLAGTRIHAADGQIVVMAFVVLGMCFTWPPLEALVSEGEPPSGLQRMVGLYNMVWAGTGAVSYFVGGAMLHHFGLTSLFFLPAAIQLIQLALTFWLARHATQPADPKESSPALRMLSGLDERAASSEQLQESRTSSPSPPVEEKAGERRPLTAHHPEASRESAAESHPSGIAEPLSPALSSLVPRGEREQVTAAHRPPTVELNPRPIAKARTFLKMAWLANPFAYVAINTLIAVIPGIAKKLELSTTLAGFCCSIWCFARLGAFWGLWQWDGWHYRFRWMLAAYLALVGTFAVLVLAPNLAVLVLAQLLFGCAVGLIYYSSLFYSMDLSSNKGEHGGIHEAAIGLGNFAGPVFGAGALYFLPGYAHSSAWAVTGLLLFGLAGLIGIWRKGR